MNICVIKWIIRRLSIAVHFLVQRTPYNIKKQVDDLVVQGEVYL